MKQDKSTESWLSLNQAWSLAWKRQGCQRKEMAWLKTASEPRTARNIFRFENSKTKINVEKNCRDKITCYLHNIMCFNKKCENGPDFVICRLMIRVLLLSWTSARCEIAGVYLNMACAFVFVWFQTEVESSANTVDMSCNKHDVELILHLCAHFHLLL